MLRTAGRSARIELKAEKESVTADDKDVCFIEADMVDLQGVTVPDARAVDSLRRGRPGALPGRVVDRARDDGDVQTCLSGLRLVETARPAAPRALGAALRRHRRGEVNSPLQ